MYYQFSDMPGATTHILIRNFFQGIKNTRLGGVEPPHMPPEGIALSTELQTHSDCMMKFINNLIYPTIK